MKTTINKKYRIKGTDEYFNKHFGHYNPEILIQHYHADFYRRGWLFEKNCLACLHFATRIAYKFDDYLPEGVWVGEVQGNRVLVHESELEEIPTL